MRYAYPARLRTVPDTILVSFRDLPEAVTEGRDRDDALRHAASCLADALWFRLKHREDIPVPSPGRRGEVLVPVEAGIAAKMALTCAFRESGWSQSEFARRLGVDRKEVQRMLDPKHATKIETLHEAMRALGRQIVLTVEAA